jgi:hypothetical protein
MYRSVPARCLAGRWSCSLSHKLVGRELGCSLDIAARGGATVRLEVKPRDRKAADSKRTGRHGP